jgi:hypothetical protein
LNYAAEKGDGDYDTRHRFTLSATYELPSPKSWAQMLEGWQVTSLASWQTGYPILMWDDSNDLSGTKEGSGEPQQRALEHPGRPEKSKVVADRGYAAFRKYL